MIGNQPVADTWPNIGGHTYCFGEMTPHISVVLEQKTIVFENTGGIAPSPPPKCPPLQPTTKMIEIFTNMHHDSTATTSRQPES